jgi:hypothetical protein
VKCVESRVSLLRTQQLDLCRICLAIASLQCCSGMYLIWGAFTARFTLSYALLLLAAFTFSNSNAAIDVVSVSCNVYNWPQDRGSAGTRPTQPAVCARTRHFWPRAQHARPVHESHQRGSGKGCHRSTITVRRLLRARASSSSPCPGTPRSNPRAGAARAQRQRCGRMQWE